MLVWALASIPVCLKAQAPMETSRHLIEVVSSVDGSPQPSYIILPSEAVVLVEQWRRVYNTVRPHSACGGLPPAPEALKPSPWFLRMPQLQGPPMASGLT